MMTTVYLALGSNVGDSRGQLKAAVGLLGASIRGIEQAPVYRSKAIGYTDQPDFLNSAVRGQTSLSPEELLNLIKAVEAKVGRTKSFRWGPREIDIDIIFYGGQQLKTSALTIPHPEFRQRDFVLRPLCDLDPRLTDPVTGRTVRDLLNAIQPVDQSIIAKLSDLEHSA